MPISVLDKGHECSNCRFSREIPNLGITRCCRNTPTHKEGFFDEWPEVAPSSWCGEWLNVISERFTYVQLSEEAQAA